MSPKAVPESAAAPTGVARLRAERPALEFGTGVFEYAPAPESADHVRLSKRYDLFIGGKFVAPKSKRYFATINPATEAKIAEVAEAGRPTSTPRLPPRRAPSGAGRSCRAPRAASISTASRG